MATHNATAPRNRPPRFREAPGRYLIVGFLLLTTVVALLAVPTYAHRTPAIGGMPFFYWYSLVWLAVNAVLQIVCYRLLVHGSRSRDRGRHRGEP